MRKSKYFFYLIVSLAAWLPGSNLCAQVNDAGLWTSINLEKKFSKKFSLHFSEELRFNENISELGVFFSELAAEYQINKYFSASAGYRFINKRNLDDSYSKRHRIIIDATAKKKMGRISAGLRVRYQVQYSDYESSSDGLIPDNYLRTRLAFKYDLNKRYTPFITGEGFYNTNRPDGILFDNYRIMAGFEYDFSKRSALDFGYIFNREVSVSNPTTSYIIGIGWSYVFK